MVGDRRARAGCLRPGAAPGGPHGFWGGRRPPRRSLRVRLAWAFLLVALLTVVVSVLALHTQGAAGPGIADLHVLWPALVVAGAAGFFTAGRITRGLSRLRAAVERLDLKDLSPRVPVEGDDEVTALALAFNRMADRLEAGERVRRDLFADVAHELRHPLAVLQGRLEAMQDGVVPLEPEQVLHLQDMVLTLVRLVGDLRDLSLADVGQLSLQRGPVALAPLVAELAENMEPVAVDRGITLALDVPADLPEVTGDPDRLRQVLVNLMANALHHTPGGGRVGVTARGDAGMVTISISDTGPGIPEADLPRIFDRFYRADGATARGGSGLGLAIVRSLVALHGGEVWAESRLGAGSRFVVRLPRGAGDGAAG